MAAEVRNQHPWKKEPHQRSSLFEASTIDDDESKSEGSNCVRFDPMAHVRSIPAVSEPENVWWQRGDLLKEQFAVHAMIQEYQRQVDGRPRWLLNRRLRRTYDSLRDVARYTKQLLSTSKTEKESPSLALQLGESLDRAASHRGMEYRLIPKRRNLERQHVNRICKAQNRESPRELAVKAAASSQQCVLLAQITGHHDATQAKICWDAETETLSR